MPTHHSIYPSIGDGGESNSLRPTFSADPRLVGITALASMQPASGTLTPALYLTEVKGAAAINVSDINQGQMGDCFLLSSIGEIALLQPSFISNMIHVSGNGTETVTLYEASDGMLPAWNTSSFKPVSETVTNVFPTNSVNSGASQDVVGGEKEIWPQVLEKAVATLDGGYSAIADGGSPLVAMEELTGRAVSYATPTNLTLASLLSDVEANDLIVMDTKSTGMLPSGLVDNHAYMFEGVTGSGASTTVHLGNPWGFDQPAPILFSQLSKGIAEVDIGHLS
jgi:hypothetical protein